MTDCLSAQEDFNSLINKLPPWVLSNFLHWLDIKLAEYKIFGRILSESERNDAKTYFSKAIGNNSPSAVSVSKARPRGLADHEEWTEPHVFPKVPHQKHGPNISNFNTPFREFTHMSNSKGLQDSIKANNNPAQSMHRILTPPEKVQLLGIINRMQTTDLETQRKHTTEIHNNGNQKIKDVEYIYLDDEKEEDTCSTVKIEPNDDEDGATSGIHADVNRKSCPRQKMAVSENQAAGSVSVIKLELPDNEYELLHADMSRNQHSDGSENSTSEIPNSTSWGQSLTSDIEVISPESSVMAEIEKSINSGNIVGMFHSINESRIPNVSQSCMADTNSEQRDNRLTSCTNVSFPGDDVKMCNLCFGLFDSNTEAESHFHVDHPGETMLSTCIYCGKGFLNEGVMRQHIVMSHLGKQSTSCVLCGKTFRQLQHVKGHLNTHRGIKDYECKLCRRSFTYKTQLTCHERQCGGFKGQFECKICHRQFLMRGHLSEHMHGVHRKSKPRYSCDFCNQTFVWRGSCNRHKRKCEKNPAKVVFLNKCS